MPMNDLRWLGGELRALSMDLGIDPAGDPANDPAEPPIVIAIDQGGHASRAIAFEAGGAMLAETFVPISTFRTGPDRVEHDAREVVESIRTALTDLHSALGEAAARVVAAGLATQRSSIVCWDRNNAGPLSPVLSWQDRRSAGFVEALRSHEPAVREQTGLVLSPHYGASKLRWCLENIDAVGDARKKKRLAAGPVAAFLLHSLLIERPHKVDPANASRTQLWDPRRREWSTPLLDLFGVPRDVLPACVPSRHAFGHLKFDQREIPLGVCTGDQSAMPFASGELDARTLYLNIGTGAFLQRTTAEGDGDHPRLLRSVLWSDEQRAIEVQEGTVNGAGSAMDWLGEQIAIDAHRAARVLTWQQCKRLSPPVFVNGIAGVGSPYWLPAVESRFVANAGGEGEAASADDMEKVVAVLESIAFMICANLELMRNGATQRVLASGGLSASNYLCDCIASLGGIAVERSTMRESTATGLAFLVCGQPGAWRPALEVETFAPRSSPALNARYARWRELMSASANPPAGRPSSRR